MQHIYEGLKAYEFVCLYVDKAYDLYAFVCSGMCAHDAPCPFCGAVLNSLICFHDMLVNRKLALQEIQKQPGQQQKNLVEC